MPKSAWPSRERIAEEETEVRGLLAGGHGRRAVNKAVAALQLAAAAARRGNNGGAALADAELAAFVFALAALWHQHKPARPDGPQAAPEILFDQELADALALFGRVLAGPARRQQS